MDLREGGALLEGREESYFAFEFDPAQVEYSPEAKTVSIRINLVSYTMKMPSGTLEGSIEDHFIGPVSKDGKTWTTERRTYERLEGAQEVSREFFDSHPRTVVFHKLDLNKAAKDQ